MAEFTRRNRRISRSMSAMPELVDSKAVPKRSSASRSRAPARRASVMSWIVPSMRTSSPPSSRIISPRARTQRVSSGERRMRAITSNERPAAIADSISATVCARSAGWMHATIAA